MKITSFKRRFAALLVAGCFAGAEAAPTLPQVVAGQASFSQQGNVFSITNTPNTIINWQSFSVNQGEVTRFIQQGSDSAVLNRIVGQDPSRILGALQSNGKVFLINPNGILFGRDARVDVNGLVASTLNLSNADFLAGKKNFTAAPGAGSIDNQGAITTPSGGQVFLIATNVENSGIISSPQGDVVLAAGHSVQLAESGNPDLHVVVAAPDSRAINLGQLVAQGGKVGIYGALVNQRGVVNANSAQVGKNGQIVLKASGDTLLEQGSLTSATGTGQGGEIHLLGQRVSVTGNAVVDASGEAGGGTVLVGGDYQGKNAQLPNAQQTLFGKDAVIRADAGAHGDGGKVVLWADGSTRAFGTISARGGAASGNGGLVETSGYSLEIGGVRVDASAALGKGGTWLIDPEDIEIVADGTDPLSAAGELVPGLARISAATLTAPGTHILLQAGRDLTINEAIRTAYDVTAQAGRDLTVNAAVETSGGNLNFSAGRRFTLGAGGSLTAFRAISIRADQATLNGNIGGPGTLRPALWISTHSAKRKIEVDDVESDDALSLNPDDFARFRVGEIRIGDSAHTGKIEVGSRFAHTANLTIENAGKISIKAPIDLSANPDSRFAALLYGDDKDSSIEIDDDGEISAGRSVLLRGDRMSIEGTIRAPSVSLMTHRASTAIRVGGSAGESDGLNIGQHALSRIRAGELTIGGLPGQFGQLRVTGPVDLTDPARSPDRLTLDAGSGLLTIAAPIRVRGTLTLKSTSGIFQVGDGRVTADKLVYVPMGYMPASVSLQQAFRACLSKPHDAGCSAVLAAGRGNAQRRRQVALASEATASLINASTSADTGATSAPAPAKPDQKPATLAANENSGAKNEKPAAKMYCN